MLHKFLITGCLSVMLFFSCQEKEASVYPAIDIAKYSEHDYSVWGDSKYYKGLGAVFLAETSCLLPDDVEDLKIARQKVYLLDSEGILIRFDLKSGRKEYEYSSRIKHFDIDTLQHRIYFLDKQQRYLSVLDATKDSILYRQTVKDMGYNYENCIFIGGTDVLLTTNSYPNAVYVLANMESGNIRACTNTGYIKSRYTQLPDTLQLKACFTGTCKDGVLFKSLLNDTVYLWKNNDFTPYALCNTNGEGVTYRKSSLWRNEALFQDNDMLALQRLDEVNGIWFVKYSHKFKRRNFESYLQSLALLRTDFSPLEVDSYIFCLDKKKVVVNTRYPYYVNKERTGLFQIYRNEAHPNGNSGNKLEDLDAIKNHKNSRNLLLCYFLF